MESVSKAGLEVQASLEYTAILLKNRERDTLKLAAKDFKNSYYIFKNIKKNEHDKNT